MRRISWVFAAAACLTATALAASPTTKYRVTILNAKGTASSVDDLGLVSGSYTTSSGTLHAALWAFGQQYDLGVLGQGAALSSRVQWPVKNDFGIISGISLTDNPDPNQEGWSCGFFLNNPNSNACQGFVWDPLSHHMRALPTLGGTNGFATGTNNFAQTAGWAETTLRDPTCIAPQVLQFLPAVWGPGVNQVHALPLLPGDSSGAATAINDRGQVVGISGECGFAVGGPTAKHAVIWNNGKPTLIANPNGAAYWNTPMMVNESGDVVGFAGVPNDPDGNFTPPFLWTRDGGFQFLPMLIGDIAGVATSINERRQVVGYSNDASSAFHAWIWENGTTTNLDSLIEPNPAMTGTLQEALDVNDRGEIAARTTTHQAVLLIPLPSR